MRFLIVLITFLLTTSASIAASQNPQPPVLAGKSWLLFDFDSAQTLVAHRPDERLEPASLTKLMSAYVVFAALKEEKITADQKVAVSENAWRQPGSRMFIEPQKTVTVEQLIRGMIVQSGNDASVALAETVAGSEDAFVHLMNHEAQRLGMKNTHYTNASGLPNEQLYTTARDLAILATAIIQDFPQQYRIYSEKSYTYNGITQPNRNRLLWMDSTVDGMKTGHTSSAGYCLVSSAKRGTRRLISVLLGTASETIRAQESLKLLNYGFMFFESVKLYDANQELARFPVWKGAQGEIAVGFENDFLLSLPKGQADRIQISLTSTQPVLAPIKKGQAIGAMKLSLDGKNLGTWPVVALQDVKLAGWFGRTWDSLRMWMKDL